MSYHIARLNQYDPTPYPTVDTACVAAALVQRDLGAFTSVYIIDHSEIGDRVAVDLDPETWEEYQASVAAEFGA